MKWTEADLRRLHRSGVQGAGNAASTAEVPFLPGDAVVICLPMPPSTNSLFFNGQRGRVRTQEYNAWIKEAGTLLALQRPPKVTARADILIEVSEDELSDSADVANREKASTDLLVSMGVIHSDSKKYVREITQRWVPGISGVRITVTPC